MALINYVEPFSFSVGEMFVGIGALIFVCTLSWIIYRLYKKIIQHMDISINRSIKYEILEEAFLDEIAKEKGIDLNKKFAENKVLKEDIKRKSFRRKIENDIYERMFKETKKASN